jgi:hypothetical protein
MATMIPSNVGFWLRWTFVCGIGEFLGIGAAAGAAFSFFLLVGETDTTGERVASLIVVVCAGILEGLITGSLQWSILRQQFVDMKAKKWLICTVLGAAVAWLIGMTYPTFFISDTASSSEPSRVMIVFLAAGSGIVLGAVFGFFQWLELRRHTMGASWWIVANTVAWIVGLVVIYLGASLPGSDTAIGTVVLIGAVSGLVAGLLVGAITGIFLVRLILPRYTGMIVLG